MQTQPRGTFTIDRIYLHTNEGPQGEGAAMGLSAYLDTIDAGYHKIRDNKVTVIKAADDKVVWGAGGDNLHALHIVLIGFSLHTDWTTPYSKAMIEGAAQEVADWCIEHGIPAVRVGPGCPPFGKGIAEHADNRCSASGGHFDPGPNFPIEDFIKRVNAIIAPPADPKLVAFFKMVASFVKPIRFGDKGKRVKFVQQQLHRRAPQLPTGKPGYYGPVLVQRIERYKRANGFKNKNGKVCGLRCVRGLFKPQPNR